MKKTVGLIFVVAAFMAAIQSCGKTPFSCFTASVNIDSIHVNQPVTFSALCTRDGKDFNWEFYDNGDSIEFGTVVIKSFPDTGTVKVYLLVTNGGKSSSTTQTLHIRP